MAKAKLDINAQVVVKNSRRAVTIRALDVRPGTDESTQIYEVLDAGGGCEATGTLEDLANHYENVKPAK